MNQPRIRDYGITVGHLPTGKLNKITDVPGVRVGHATIDTDRQKTGVPVILPPRGICSLVPSPPLATSSTATVNPRDSCRCRSWAPWRPPSP